VNHLVRVNVAGSADVGMGEAAEDVRTRVEDVVEPCAEHGRRYLIAAPRYLGDLELPGPGTPCTLEWPGPNGIWILPVTYVDEQQIRDGLRAWLMEVLAPARQSERRSFVRVEWALPLTLEPLSVGEARLMGPGSDGLATLAAADIPPALQGRTVNLSEGGFRCLLPAPVLNRGVGVAAKLEIAQEMRTLVGRVQRVRPTGSHGGAEFDTAVVFDDPGRHGDWLRPLLFAEQLRIRRAGLA
jgi:hypothetical protein